MIVGRVWRGLAELLLPSCCPSCLLARGPALCLDCREDMELVLFPCPRCGAPRRDPEQRCGHCRDRGLPMIRSLRAPLVYRGRTAALIGRAKAGGSHAAIVALAEQAAHLWSPPVEDLVITAVPPNPGRRDGPHLASACARAVATRHGLRFARYLSTTRPAAVQHSLRSSDRQRAVEDLFAVHLPSSAVGSSVLLVDDILTSGATIQAAARALRRNGIATVYAFCLARTPLASDPRVPDQEADEEA